MSSLQPTIRAALTKFCQDNEGKETASDILRAIQEEAYLMKETQDLHDVLTTDPMEQFGEIQSYIERLKTITQVTSCRRLWTAPYPDYCGINAVVTFKKPKRTSSSSTSSLSTASSTTTPLSSNESILQLTFRYERKKRQDIRDGCHVWYSIETSQDYGPKENLLVVQVWAQSSSPSPKRAVCMNRHYDDDDEAEEEGGWEDMDDDEDEEEHAAVAAVGNVIHGKGHNVNNNRSSNAELIPADDDSMESSSHSSAPGRVANKKQKVNGSHLEEQPATGEGGKGSKKASSSGNSDEVDKEGCAGFEVGDDNEDDDEEDGNGGSERDSYTAYLDPDLLHEFLDWNGFTMNDGTAFFLLMTFPYFEHEWDLIGFVLDEVFGGNDESDDDNGST